MVTAVLMLAGTEPRSRGASPARDPGLTPCARTRAWRCSSSCCANPAPSSTASRSLEEQSGWDAHASYMDALVDGGFIVLGGPLAGDGRVAHAVEAESEDAVRATFARDPWSETHLQVDRIDPWTIRLDARAG